MFLDLWLKFCCSQRQKPEAQDQPIQDEKQTHLDSGPSTAEQRVPLTSSQELRQKIHDSRGPTPQGPQTMNSLRSLKQGVKTSLEMQIEEPVDTFLALSDNKSSKIPSWEALEQARQSDVLSQLAGFTKLAQSQASSNNNSQHQAFSNGSIHHPEFQLNNLAQTIHLQPIEEYPNKSLARSTSFNQIDKKKIAKEKKPKKDKPAREKQPKDKQPKIWEQQEDNILKECYSKFNGNWREIAQHLPGRNMNQCAQRWRRLNPQAQNKKKWTFEDDIKIKQLYEKHKKNWAEIAKHFPGKTGKQIRERFLNKLDPAIRLDAWTIEEDEVILKVFKENGPKWSIAAKQLKGRPENMVKNRFYSYIRRVVLGQQNPYSVVLNQNARDMLTGDTGLESDSSKQPFSVDQTPSFTGSSMLSSYMDDEDMMEDEPFDEEPKEDQIKI